MSLDELELPKNNLFKFTCIDGHDSPNYTFTWELTAEGAEILREKGVRYPFMYVMAVEEVPPKKDEHDFENCGYNHVVEQLLVPLHKGSGQIQFHRTGTFRIYAMVVWYPHASNWNKAQGYILDRHEIGQYRDCVLFETGKLGERCLPHVEEDVIRIGSGFFTSEPNPTLWWWANLWFSSEPENTCEYKKRLLALLWVEVPVVGIYVVLRALLMACCYVICWLIGFRLRSFSLRPMFHPFSSVFEQFCEATTKNNVATSKDGQERSFLGGIVRLPLVWVVVPVLLVWLSSKGYHHPKAALLCLLVVVGGSILGTLLHFLGVYFKRGKKIEGYYASVPIEKPQKSPRVPIRVRWLKATGKRCLPFPE